MPDDYTARFEESRARSAEAKCEEAKSQHAAVTRVAVIVCITIAWLGWCGKTCTPMQTMHKIQESR